MNYKYYIFWVLSLSTLVTDWLTNESVLLTEEANSKVVVVVADVNFTFGDTLKKIGWQLYARMASV